MRITTGVVLWLVAAVAATTAGLFAVGAIGTGIFGAQAQRPLTESEVDRRLAESAAPPATTTRPPPSSRPSTTRPPSTTTPATSATPPAAQPTVIRSDGGTVIAECTAGGVRVLGATPAQGYQVESEDEDHGVDDHPTVKFTSGEQEIRIRLRCVGGTVTHTVENH